MGTVTYRKQQSAASALKKGIPLVGTSHVYKCNKVLWPKQLEGFLKTLLIFPSLHVCCGKSQLGDVRLDLYEDDVDIKCDAADMREYVDDDEYASVLCDPPYTGRLQWQHNLLSELSRIAYKRIIFQNWYLPANIHGYYRKAQEKFKLTNVYLWNPKTYFGRVQVISVFDRIEEEKMPHLRKRTKKSKKSKK